MATQGPRPLVAGNWKMNGTSAMLKEPRLLAGMLKDVKLKCEVIVCPPATLIRKVKSILKGTKIKLGGQDCHAAASGAHTGDISAEMLKDAGCTAVIVGHSERRANHGETDAQVAAKAAAAHRAGLVAIVCIGETLEERKAGKTLEVVSRQLKGSLPEGAASANTVIAYEPVWAIGTGQTVTPKQASETHQFIRQRLSDLFGPSTAAFVKVLYGGSITSENVSPFVAEPQVDGLLVGGASLDFEEFSEIVKCTALRRS